MSELNTLFRNRHFAPVATSFPRRCVALPQLGDAHAKGYLKLGELDPPGTYQVTDGVDNKQRGGPCVAYVSVEFLRTAARELPELGLALADDLAATQAQLEQADAEIDDLRAQVQKLEQEQNAIDVLAHKDGHYAKHKRTGRPPKETANAKAGS